MRSNCVPDEGKSAPCLASVLGTKTKNNYATSTQPYFRKSDSTLDFVFPEQPARPEHVLPCITCYDPHTGIRSFKSRAADKVRIAGATHSPSQRLRGINFERENRTRT